MKKINIYPIRSLMGHGDMISEDSKLLLDELRKRLSGFEIAFSDSPKGLAGEGLPLILVQSGGSEGIFLKDVYPLFKGPYYLLTYGSCNSLAASLEILTFLKDRNESSEVLHGDYDYIASRIRLLSEGNQRKIEARLGILGEPSDWLISSAVDKKQCQEKLGITLVDIPENEVIEAIKAVKLEEVRGEENFDYDHAEIKKALRIYEGLKTIVAKYDLKGFTIRCFDIIQAVKSSACLALALFNKDGILATCEGDVPAMLTAYLLLDKYGIHAFQANPQWIDPVANTVELAHCTLPLDMTKKVVYDTHFESGIGVGIHGELDLGPVTIVKLSADMREFYCEEGTLTQNDYRKDRCRTQVKIALDAPVSYFLTSSLGNHHQIIYGHHKEEIKSYLQGLGMRNVVA